MSGVERFRTAWEQADEVKRLQLINVAQLIDDRLDEEWRRAAEERPLDGNALRVQYNPSKPVARGIEYVRRQIKAIACATPTEPPLATRSAADFGSGKAIAEQIIEGLLASEVPWA
jgi:hypothetical protein